MNTYQGFSLTEVLVALFLLTTTSLTLLQQQWRTNQLFNQASLRSLALTQLDNNSERIIARQALAMVKEPFHWQTTQTSSTVTLQISWSAALTGSDCCHLQRQIVLS
ncbi:prepilin-type N-terminal cleavage/methylation domain-containing protein [Legionella tunisiensis]|uniref:prepilin-type N-terminal cleavage/methylation domain-containing protein n=1 Tax=Legionella tunisiensis TaxID=1034944 RepID=UPI0002D2B4B5|nr:prepilin-type N-terminal cleavage/methylation domain-containing protein [Legionella tunisiensis]